jgi:hypothetical protein
MGSFTNSLISFISLIHSYTSSLTFKHLVVHTFTRSHVHTFTRSHVHTPSDGAAGVEHPEEGGNLLRAGARDTQAAAALARALAVLPFKRRAADGSFPPEQNTWSESK